MSKYKSIEEIISNDKDLMDRDYLARFHKRPENISEKQQSFLEDFMEQILVTVFDKTGEQFNWYDEGGDIIGVFYFGSGVDHRSYSIRIELERNYSYLESIKVAFRSHCADGFVLTSGFSYFIVKLKYRDTDDFKELRRKKLKTTIKKCLVAIQH